MQAQVAKWGNSLAVRIPKAVAERARLREGERLEMSVNDDGALVLRAARPSFRLDDLLAGVSDDNRHDETDWGAAQGKETW
ncbi:MAG: AbrB/MazE/SpoVT family DNA-binding domain-containing protein [Pseudomonadota bacterium]